MSGTFPFEVVDHKLQVGRGEEFSASRQREQQYADFETGQWQLPINHRVEDGLDTDARLADANTALSEENVGFKMLQRMGWKGKGLGRAEQGLVEPVKGGVEAGMRLGVGKAEEDDHYTAAENVARKRLDIEVAAEEDADQALLREMAAEKEIRRRQEVSDIIRTFYCDTCHKQYNTAVELETHLSSYDHHHKKRLVEMRQATSTRTKHERGKREKRAAEKEMARLNAQIQRAQQAAGILPATPVPDAAPPPPPPLDGSEPPPLPSSPPPLPPGDIVSAPPPSDAPPPAPTHAGAPSQHASAAVPDWAPMPPADPSPGWGAPSAQMQQPPTHRAANSQQSPQSSRWSGYPPAAPASLSSPSAHGAPPSTDSGAPAAVPVPPEVSQKVGLPSMGTTKSAGRSTPAAAAFCETGHEPGPSKAKGSGSSHATPAWQGAGAHQDNNQSAAAPEPPKAVQFGFPSGSSRPQQAAGPGAGHLQTAKRPALSGAGFAAKRSKLAAPMAAFLPDDDD